MDVINIVRNIRKWGSNFWRRKVNDEFQKSNQEPTIFSKLTGRLVVRSIEVLWFWGTLPLRWNKQSGSLEIIHTKWRKFLWFFNALAQLLNFSFLIFRYVQLYFLPSVPDALKTYLEYVILCFCYGTMYQTILCFSLDDVVDFIDGYKGLFATIPRNLERNLKTSRRCDTILGRYMAFGHAALSLNLLILFRRPERLVYFTSMLEDPRGLGALGITPFAAVHVYIWWSMWSLLHFIEIHTMAYVSAQVAVLECIKNKMNAMEEVRMDGKKLGRLYRESQVLQVKFDSGLGWLLAAGRISVMFLIIRGVYSGLVETGALRILCFTVGFLAWAHHHAAFNVLGQLHEVSSDALNIMKLKNRDPWFRRFHRSCTPLKVRMTRMIFCDRGLTMSFTSFIFDSIVGLVVAQST